MRNQTMFDWNDLRYFLAVARHGSTLAAAKALRLSQSTVHRRLAALEDQLGRRLVKRHPTGYRLTRLGEQMLPHAEGVEASVADFERQFVASDPSRGGLVRISCPASAAHRLMAVRLLDKFHARHPALRAEFVMTEEFFDLAQGEVELAIWQGAPQDRTLIVRRIADVPWAVFASGAYIEAHGRPRQPKEIIDHPVVEFAGPMKNHAAALWLRSVAPRAAVAARGNSVSEVIEAIKSGVGVGPLPIPHAKRESELVMVVESRPELNFPFYVVIHRDIRRVRRVRAFLDFLAGEQKLVRRALEVGVERKA
jgi:DNA-binding transcriptional LysR family regulator